MKTLGIISPLNHFFIFFLICFFIISSATFIPLLGSLFVLFLPAVLFYYGVTNYMFKTGGAFLISLIPFLFLARFSQFNPPFPEILTLGFAGLVMAAIVLRNETFQKTVINTSLIIAAPIGVYILYSGYDQNLNLWQIINNFVAEAIEYNIHIYAQLPLKKEDIDLIADNKNNIINIFTKVFPSLVIVACTFTAWFNTLLGRNILRRRGILFSRIENLSVWSAPEFIVWIFIASGALIFIGPEILRTLCLNVLIIVCFIYLLQGLAIISFIFQNKNVPVFFRYFFYFLIAVQQFFMIPVVATGLLDIWIDFRRFFQKKEPTD